MNHSVIFNKARNLDKKSTMALVRNCIFVNGKQVTSVLCRKCMTDNRKDMTGNFVADYEASHIQTSAFQKIALSVGSSVASLLDPSRGDMIAILGETTGERALRYMLAKMQESPEGQEILKEKPRINSQTVDLSRLQSLPERTVGKIYSDFLEKNKVTPDSRLTVQFVDDIELAYVMQRYREVHDLVHAILGMPTNMLGEVTVKWVEGLQTRLPMCVGGGLFGAIRLAPKQRIKYLSKNLPWAIQTGLTANFIMNTFFEKRWEQPLVDLHKELNIKPLSS